LVYLIEDYMKNMSWASKPTKKRCHTNIGVEKEEGEMVLDNNQLHV
jgi:hypothetical protein